MRLHGADAAVRTGRESGDGFALLQTAAGECAGHHRADALQGKYAISREARLAIIHVRRHGIGGGGKSGLQFVQAGAIVGGDRDDGSFGQWTVL